MKSAGLCLLNLDRRNTRPAPRPQQRRQDSIHEIRPARHTANSCPHRSLSLFSDQLLIRLHSLTSDRRRSEHSAWSSISTVHFDEDACQPFAGSAHSAQVPILRLAGRFHRAVATLSRQPEPGELAHRYPQVCPRYPLEMSGSQLHTTTRSQTHTTVSSQEFTGVHGARRVSAAPIGRKARTECDCAPPLGQVVACRTYRQAIDAIVVGRSCRRPGVGQAAQGRSGDGDGN
jgi:hypothetical protein